MRGLSSELPEALPDIDDRLMQVESLVASRPDEATFARELVQLLLGASGAAGAQVWASDGSAPVRLLHQSFVTPEGLQCAETLPEPLLSAVALVSGRRQSSIVLPGSTRTSAGSPHPQLENPTLFYWVISPLHGADTRYGALVAWLESDLDPRAVQRVSELVDTYALLAVPWFEQQRLRTLQEDNRFWTEASSLLERLHSETSLDEVAFTAANGIRTLLSCDRAWVLLRAGRSCRVLAVSGVQQPDYRSNQMRSLRKLAGALAAARLPLTWERGAGLTQAPSLKSLINAYLDESHLAKLNAVPLMRPADEGKPSRCLGMLFVEWFVQPDTPGSKRDVNPLASQVAVALQNARDWQLAPLAARLRMLRRAVRVPWGKWLLSLALVAGAAAALVLVPADFTVEARGELLPAKRRHVFAAEEGTIDRLNVRTGDTVQAGQTVILLRNLALDQELQRVSGELSTTQRKIVSLEARRLDFESNPNLPASERLQVTAELEELRVTKGSLARQLRLLEERQKLMALVSPLSGEVQTWDVEQLLNGRPVRRGQQLLTVADTSGPWILEVQVPDSRTGDVQEARKTHTQPLKVEFALATDPGRLHSGRLSSLAMSAETRDSATGPAVLAMVDLDTKPLSELHGGARVTAKIHCGKRPVGYVWFIDAWRAIQRWALF